MGQDQNCICSYLWLPSLLLLKMNLSACFSGTPSTVHLSPRPPPVHGPHSAVPPAHPSIHFTLSTGPFTWVHKLAAIPPVLTIKPNQKIDTLLDHMSSVTPASFF